MSKLRVTTLFKSDQLLNFPATRLNYHKLTRITAFLNGSTCSISIWFRFPPLSPTCGHQLGYIDYKLLYSFTHLIFELKSWLEVIILNLEILTSDYNSKSKWGACKIVYNNLCAISVILDQMMLLSFHLKVIFFWVVILLHVDNHLCVRIRTRADFSIAMFDLPSRDLVQQVLAIINNWCIFSTWGFIICVQAYNKVSINYNFNSAWIWRRMNFATSVISYRCTIFTKKTHTWHMYVL